MATLQELIVNGLQYDRSWAIYAERINGEFTADSPARIGQTQFENGGVLDNCEYFADGIAVCEFVNDYTEGLPDEDVSSFLAEAAREMISEYNQD